MIRLTSPGLDPLTLDDWETGIVASSVDFGWPSVRAVVTDRPGADGTIDETRFFGARTVTVVLNVFAGSNGSRRASLDKLAAFCHPGRRSVMEWEDPTGGGVRTVELRADQSSAPLTNPNVAAVSITWVAPSGVFTSAAANELAMLPSGDPGGRTYDRDGDRSYPSYEGGDTYAVNLGTTPATWVARIYGPCTGPTLTNAGSGLALSFPTLTIAEGDYLEVDAAARTVQLNGDPGASRYGFLDFAVSSWWTLEVGASVILFTAESHEPPASASLIWKDTYL